MKFLAFFLVLSLNSSARLIERVQAQVGEEMISFISFNNFHKQLKAGLIPPSLLLNQIYNKSELLNDREKLMDFMVDRAMLFQISDQENSITVSEKEVDKVFAKLKANSSLKSFKQKLNRYGLNLSTFRKQIQISLQNDLFLSQISQSRVIISEQDISAYYFNKYQKPLFKTFEYEFVSLPFSEKDKERVLNRLINVKDSEELEDMAKNLGLESKFFKLKDKDIQKLFKKELMRLSVSQISPLIIQGGNYYVLQLKWKSPEISPKEAKLKDQIGKKLYTKKLKEEIQKWLEEKRAGFFIIRHPFKAAWL